MSDAQTHAETRFGFFVDHDLLERVPSRWQIGVGWLAMLPITLSESERERERSRQTWMGQVPIRVPLQLLYNPSQGVGTGLDLPPHKIVRHLLSVYHEDAFLGYDLQLLHSHPGGLALLRKEALAVVEGRTRWAPVLRKLVGYPGYHARLAELAQQAEEFVYPNTLDLDPRFVTLVGFGAFCNTLPDWPAREFYGFDLDKLSRGGPR